MLEIRFGGDWGIFTFLSGQIGLTVAMWGTLSFRAREKVMPHWQLWALLALENCSVP